MRVKSGVPAHARHRKVRRQTKGMQRARRTRYGLGKQAVIRSLQYAYRDRRQRKRDFRQLWTIRINAAAREHGLTYSRLIAGLKQAKIELDRKSLAELAVREPEAFAAVIKQIRPPGRKPSSRAR